MIYIYIYILTLKLPCIFLVPIFGFFGTKVQNFWGLTVTQIIAPLLISTPEQIQVFRFLDKECKQVYKITFI